LTTPFHLTIMFMVAFGEGSTQAQRWFKQHETLLFQGHADQIAQAIAEMAEKQPDQGEELRQHAGYFEKHQHRMNYLEMRSEG
jgi:hypothetical protein